MFSSAPGTARAQFVRLGVMTVLGSIASTVLQCHGPSGPGDSARVDLVATLSSVAPAPGEPVVATVEARNRGVAVWYDDRCCLPDFAAPLVAPDGLEYWPYNPLPACRCLDFRRQLEPNQRVSERIEFLGTLYDAHGQPSAAPDGRYVWRFGLRYYTTNEPPPSNWKQAVTSIEFTWTAAQR